MKHDFKKILHDAGLKSTNPRLAVIKTLSEIKRPETAQEIHRRLEKLDLVTLYRTLTSFEKSGILKRVDLRKEATHYELSADHHHHMICTSCEKVEDFENTEIEKLIEEIFKKSYKFKRIKEHSLELFGLCRMCS